MDVLDFIILFALSACLICDWYTKVFLDQIHLISLKKNRQKRVSAGAVQYYRIYKNIYMQSKIGISPFEIMKRLYLMTEHKALRSVFYEISERITHSNDIDKGIDLLRDRLADEDSKMFINILRNSSKTGFSASAMRQLDHMFFQKYLIGIKNNVKKVRRRYFFATLLFCSAVFIAIFMPVVNEMFLSVQSVFKGY